MKKLFLFAFLFLSTVFVQSQTITACYGSTINLGAFPAVPNSTLVGYPINPSGDYILTATASANYTLKTSLTNSVVKTVTVVPQPYIALSFTQPSCQSTLGCFNFNLTFSSTGGPAPTYTVNWLPPSGTPSPNIPGCAITSPTIVSCCGAAPGSYTGVITAAGGCSVSGIININNAPAQANFALSPAGTTHTLSCVNPTLILTASPSIHTYTWNQISFAPSFTDALSLTYINSSTLSPVIVTVIATNTVSNCTKTQTVAVIVNTAVPTYSASSFSQVVSCANPVQAVTVTAISPTVNYQHSLIGNVSFTSNNNPANFIPTPSLGLSTYSYCLSNLANGCSVCAQMSITSTSSNYPTYTITSTNNFSLGCSTKSTTSITFTNVNSTPPGGNITFTFLPPGTSSVLPSGTLSTISQTFVSIPGVYTVVARDNNAGCETRNIIYILDNKFGPTLDSISSVSKTLTCAFPATTLQAYSETPNISYQWQYGTGPQTVISPSIIANATLSLPTRTVVYDHTVTLTDNSSLCKTPTIVTVYQNVAPPSSSFAPANSGTNAITCANLNIQLSNQSRTGITAFATLQPVIGYLWFGPSPQPTVSPGTSYNASVVGTYSMIGLDLNNGCTSMFTLNIVDGKYFPNVIPPVVNFTLDCGSVTTVTDQLRPTIDPTQIGFANFSYSWTAPPPAQPGVVPNLSYFVPKTIGVHTVVATNTLNGCATTKTMMVDPGRLFALVAFTSDSVGFAPLNVSFINNSFSGSNKTNSITTIWSFGNDTYSTTPQTTINPSVIYNTPGTYTLKVYTSKSPCRDSTSKIIIVNLPSKLEIPNVFTPNGDNINDFFFLKTSSLVKISISIYDRWGRLVFIVNESTTGNISWDGKTPEGKDAPDGTYFYYLNALGKDGKEYDKIKGNISLMR